MQTDNLLAPLVQLGKALMACIVVAHAKTMDCFAEMIKVSTCRVYNSRGLAGSQVCLYVFDVLWLETDRRPAPLCDRRALIGKVFPAESESVRISESFEDGAALFKAVDRLGLEGVVSKLKTSPYSSGRSKEWRKVKTKAWLELNRRRWKVFR